MRKEKKQYIFRRELNVPFQQIMIDGVATGAVACGLRKLAKHSLAYAPWPAFPYKPAVQFSIAHCPTAILLQFEVTEKIIKATHSTVNAPVYKDSCVEFFICFDEGPAYYNIECNCIGTLLAGFGKKGMPRELLPQTVLKKVKTEVLIHREEEQVHWEATLVLPLEIFIYHPSMGLQGRRCDANFYKCGDELPEPHFLSWSNIVSEKPNFHLPEFFGVLNFQ
jgi:hypothetical protein